ncbi:MAG: D-glycerate dehydrogenase [Trueperaceae bacterium]|nr:MAG: D-glycerate dehydrogenase [Trueperaceae bacterium]
MRRVFVTRRLPEAGVRGLLAAPDLVVDIRQRDDAIPRQELLQRIEGCSGVITILSDRVDREFLAAAGDHLRIVANYAVGFDNIDLAACSEAGVAVSNTPDVLTNATADLAMALMLAVSRRFREGQSLAESGSWSGWEPMQLLGRDVSGATLGIIGMGRIGTALAKRAQGFAMNVLYHNRRPNPEAESRMDVRFAELPSLLEQSDFVSLHCPLSEATHHLIGAPELKRMKESAVIINTARGAIIDEQALLEALLQKQIWGAGLDVFEREPEITQGLAHLPNVVMLPHLGSATTEARTAMARLCSEAVLAVLQHKKVAHLLNPEVIS